MNINDAIILGAGKGKRMKKNNPNLIKPLINVNEKVLIGYIIEGLARAHIKTIHIIQSPDQDLGILKKLYPNLNIKFYNHDNNNTALIAIKSVEKEIEDDFILADCDIVCDIDELQEVLEHAKQSINDVDGLVISSDHPTFVNNHYLKVNGNQVIGFDKSGNKNNVHGGFLYVFKHKFYHYLNEHIDQTDMAYILDGYFQKYNVRRMNISDIWDIDEEKEIEPSKQLLKQLTRNKQIF